MFQELEEEFEVPLYCFHSKFFLVEELALNDNLLKFHYGRCCIIGKIAVDTIDPSKHFIENIRLPSLDEEYSLPEGSVRLRIKTSNLRRHIPYGKICEIVGEAILYDTIDIAANRSPLTSKDVAEKAKLLQTNNLSVSEYHKNLLSRYQPAVNVDYLKTVVRGAELAERNYEIKMLCANSL